MKYRVIEKDDCIGEYKVYIYILEKILTRDFCNMIGKIGDLKIFENFPRPYFRVSDSSFLLKSIIGSTEIEVTYYDYSTMKKKDEVEKILILKQACNFFLRSKKYLKCPISLDI